MAGELAYDPTTDQLVYSPSTGQLALTCGVHLENCDNSSDKLRPSNQATFNSNVGKAVRLVEYPSKVYEIKDGSPSGLTPEALTVNVLYDDCNSVPTVYSLTPLQTETTDNEYYCRCCGSIDSYDLGSSYTGCGSLHVVLEDMLDELFNGRNVTDGAFGSSEYSCFSPCSITPYPDGRTVRVFEYIGDDGFDSACVLDANDCPEYQFSFFISREYSDDTSAPFIIDYTFDINVDVTVSGLDCDGGTDSSASFDVEWLYEGPNGNVTSGSCTLTASIEVYTNWDSAWGWRPSKNDCTQPYCVADKDSGTNVDSCGELSDAGVPRCDTKECRTYYTHDIGSYSAGDTVDIDVETNICFLIDTETAPALPISTITIQNNYVPSSACCTA